jgi:metallophosphoesterase superfamily enzyme
MNRLALARELNGVTAMPGVETAVHGVAAVCDPLGGLYLPDAGILVVSDLHLEKGAAFARRGMMLPPYDTLATLTVLSAVITRSDLARGREWIWINGNHDPDGTVDLPGTCADEMHHAGLTFRHEPKGGLQRGEIAGHLHPSATVRRREKSIRRPCFATDGARLLMPAFGVMSGGLDLRHKAMKGLFDQPSLIAHLLGRDRIYSVRFGNLLG